MKLKGLRQLRPDQVDDRTGTPGVSADPTVADNRQAFDEFAKGNPRLMDRVPVQSQLQTVYDMIDQSNALNKQMYSDTNQMGRLQESSTPPPMTPPGVETMFPGYKITPVEAPMEWAGPKNGSETAKQATEAMRKAPSGGRSKVDYGQGKSLFDTVDGYTRGMEFGPNPYASTPDQGPIPSSKPVAAKPKPKPKGSVVKSLRQQAVTPGKWTTVDNLKKK